MEEIAKNITLTTGHLLEIISATIISVALIKLFFLYFRSFLIEKNGISVIKTRIAFGSSVAVSLEILLAADVLATAVAPSWDDIGKLAAIATIRTVLNYFLEKELSHSPRKESTGN